MGVHTPALPGVNRLDSNNGVVCSSTFTKSAILEWIDRRESLALLHIESYLEFANKYMHGPATTFAAPPRASVTPLIKLKSHLLTLSRSCLSLIPENYSSLYHFHCSNSAFQRNDIDRALLIFIELTSPEINIIL